MKTIIPLGKLADEGAGRDAIHIAVAPVEASERLSVGQHVGIDTNGKASPQAQPIGIVDPYLKAPVEAGEKFYLCLYPNTITSLRHHWVHPAFRDEGPAKPEDDKAASKAWLLEYATRVNPYYVSGPYGHSPDEAYRRLMDDIDGGNNITYNGVDMHGLDDLIDAAELRRHAEVVLGRKLDWGTFEYFGCTC